MAGVAGTEEAEASGLAAVSLDLDGVDLALVDGEAHGELHSEPRLRACVFFSGLSPFAS